MKMIFKYKSVYGNDVYYPENEQAKAVCRVAGRKTLKLEKLAILKQASFEVVIQHEQILLEKVTI